MTFKYEITAKMLKQYFNLILQFTLFFTEVGNTDNISIVLYNSKGNRINTDKYIYIVAINQLKLMIREQFLFRYMDPQ